jgi:queuine tRNA-ribosyltransferase
MPTRNARHGTVFTRFGKINIKNARFAEDNRPLDETSNCPAMRDYSRAYLHHLFRADEMLGKMLLTWVNLAYYQDLMAGARAAISNGTYQDYMAETKAGWTRSLGEF